MPATSCSTRCRGCDAKSSGLTAWALMIACTGSSHGSWCAADFLRVGALRRIDRRLLRHSLHCGAGGRERGDEAAELADMLKAATSPAEAAVLRAELAEARCLCLLAGQSLVPCQHHKLKEWAVLMPC